jgi:hypothetical protein
VAQEETKGVGKNELALGPERRFVRPKSADGRRMRSNGRRRFGTRTDPGGQPKFRPRPRTGPASRERTVGEWAVGPVCSVGRFGL